MPEPYYDIDESKFPYVAYAILARIILYFFQILYPKEPIEEIHKRFLLANFDDDANAIKKSVDAFKKTNGKFPFTAYNPANNIEPVSEKSHLQKSGNYYCNDIGTYVALIPIRWEIPFVTYYTTPEDFWKAISMLHYEAASLTRLDVPIELNGVQTSFPIDLNFNPDKGNLAFDIEQQFTVGSIYPVVHITTVKCHLISLAENYMTTGGGCITGLEGGHQKRMVHLIENMHMNLRKLEDAEIISTASISNK